MGLLLVYDKLNKVGSNFRAWAPIATQVFAGWAAGHE